MHFCILFFLMFSILSVLLLLIKFNVFDMLSNCCCPYIALSSSILLLNKYGISIDNIFTILSFLQIL